MCILNGIHCVKSVHTGVISGTSFSAFGLNTERYEVPLRIQSECWKIRTRNNSVFGQFSRSDKEHNFSIFICFPENQKQMNITSSIWPKLQMQQIIQGYFKPDFMKCFVR